MLHSFTHDIKIQLWKASLQKWLNWSRYRLGDRHTCVGLRKRHVLDRIHTDATG